MHAARARSRLLVAASRGMAWAGAAGYVAFVLAPLLAAWRAAPLAPARSFAAEAAVAAGYVAFALGAGECVLVARLRAASLPFGTDALMLLHRRLGELMLLFVLAHALVAGGPVRAWGGSAGERAGALAAWSAVVLVVVARARRRLPCSYEAWRAVHGVLALAVVGGGLAHALLLGRRTDDAAVRTVLCGEAALFVVLAVQLRLVRPLRMGRRPWEVVAAQDAGGDVTRLVVRPVGHAGVRFSPGQFAWLATGSSPLRAQQHPLSIASSAEPGPDGRVEFAIKALGDWSRDVVPRLAPGTRVWLEAPYGAFSPDRVRADGFVLIAGGIGYAPMRSMLLTFADRGERRPITLVLAARNRSRTCFGDELDALARRLPLRVVRVFEEPEPDGGAEAGLVTAALLARHVPEPRDGLAFLVCGPGPMMRALERELDLLGVRPSRILTERFDMV